MTNYQRQRLLERQAVFEMVATYMVAFFSFVSAAGLVGLTWMAI